MVFGGSDLLSSFTTDCEAKLLFSIFAFSRWVSAGSLLYIRVRDSIVYKGEGQTHSC